MDRNKIEFDISSIDNTEYKLREIAALTSEEIDRLEKEKQILFISVRDDIEPISNILIMAPKAWFGGEMEFLSRVQGDLRNYVLDAFENLYNEGSESIGELIDHMGLIPFINYVSLDLMEKFSASLDGTDESELFMEDVEEYSHFKLLLAQQVNNTMICDEVLSNEHYLIDLIAQAEIISGVMYVQSDYGTNIKESYVMKIRLLNNLKCEEDAESTFVEGVKALYMNFLT